MAEKSFVDPIYQLEDGRLLWLNPETDIYEFVEASSESHGCSTINGATFDNSDHSKPENNTVPSVVKNDASSRNLYELDEISNKLWNDEETLLLISLVKKHNDELERGIKKFVWKKIADEIYVAIKKIYTQQQIETKWKGLVRYYKEIIKWNNTSENSKKEWKFFKVINDILFKRPEINAEATGDSHTGLLIKTTKGMVKASYLKDNKSPSDESSDIESDGPNSFESNFSRKRKQKESAVSKRHAEKMQKLDRLADIMDKLVEVVKNKKNPEDTMNTH